MPSILSHPARRTTKTLFIGDSGTGKTGALASLATSGQKLRIIDLDNGLDILKNLLTDPASTYAKQLSSAKIDLSEAIQYVTLTETMRETQGRLIPAKATVWDRTVKLLSHWKDGEIDLGPVTSWGPDTTLVIDSLTMLSTAALNFIQAMNGHLGAYQTAAGRAGASNENRREIGMAQGLIESLLQMLYDDAVKCNVIVMSHIVYVDESGGVPTLPGENAVLRGYPSALGRALSPKIPRYFNNVIQAKTTGSGSATRHRIYTMPQGAVDLKSSAPTRVKAEYPLETGLAEFFTAVRGE